MARQRVLQFRSKRNPERARISHPDGVAWRLVDESGRLLVGEIQSPADAHAAWHVVLWLDGLPQITRPCADREQADFVARALMEDQLLGGAQPVGLLRALR